MDQSIEKFFQENPDVEPKVQLYLTIVKGEDTCHKNLKTQKGVEINGWWVVVHDKYVSKKWKFYIPEEKKVVPKQVEKFHEDKTLSLWKRDAAHLTQNINEVKVFAKDIPVAAVERLKNTEVLPYYIILTKGK